MSARSNELTGIGMDDFNRRDFLRGSTIAAAASTLGLLVPADAASAPASPSSAQWDAGRVRHLLPTASDSRVLVKASFHSPLTEAPMLRIGATTVRGRMTDTRGEFWQFHAADLKPGRPYTLALAGNRGRALCEPWSLATFPAPDEKPQSFRVLFYTCAGGHEAFGFLPPAIRNRLLRRALSFAPTALVAIGDQVYWDLLAPENGPKMGASPAAERIAGKFDRSALVLGSDNETVLKRAVEPQLIPVYGTDFRSTPVFFMQDDHDYFDNDEATDEVITFPPPYFSLQLARATQSLFYPEFLPDRARPLGLPWSAAGDRYGGVSETFGTVRYGRLAEILLYDIRRTQTLAGPSAVYLDLSANPINAVLTGPISTRPSGWPSARRGTGALPPTHLDMAEDVKPTEQHGFTIADFEPDKIVLRMFKWDVKTQSVEAIDNLDPFHTAVLTRPA